MKKYLEDFKKNLYKIARVNRVNWGNFLDALAEIKDILFFRDGSYIITLWDYSEHYGDRKGQVPKKIRDNNLQHLFLELLSLANMNMFHHNDYHLITTIVYPMRTDGELDIDLEFYAANGITPESMSPEDDDFLGKFSI